MPRIIREVKGFEVVHQFGKTNEHETWTMEVAEGIFWNKNQAQKYIERAEGREERQINA